MSGPLWTILIATLASREAKFRGLMGTLLPQAEAAGRVEVIACHNNGERPLGDIRQALLMSAAGTYVSFLDDDDGIPPYFCEAMIPALEKGPDVAGFWMEYHEGGVHAANSYHSLRHEPHDEGGVLYRDLTHQMPVRTVLAQQGDFRDAWPEDNAWRNKVRPLLATEEYIDRCMYYYRHDWSDSVQGNLTPHTHTPRPEISSACFRWLDLPGA